MGINPDTAPVEQINKALVGMGRDPLPSAPPSQPAGEPPAPGTIPSTSTDTDGLSGEAADVAKQLDAALEKNRTELNAADEQLADAILHATSSSEQGKKRLEALQQSIIDEVKKLGPTLDTPAGQQQLADFLQGKTSGILEVVKTAGLDSQSQGQVLDALAAQYEALNGQKSGTSTNGDAPGAPEGTPGGLPGGAPGSPTGEPGGEMPLPNDPLLNGLASDPLMAGLGSLAGPAMGALGSVPGMMGSMIPPLGAPIGGGVPFGDIGAGIGSALRDPARAGGDSGAEDNSEEPLKDPARPGKDPQSADAAKAEPSQDPNDDATKPAAGPGQAPAQGPDAAPGQAAPPPAAPAGGDKTVKLPNGETVTASSAAVANAGRKVLEGADINDAFAQAGIPLSPPGTPVTAPVSPSSLSFGDLGQFTDHRVMALGPTKVWVNGQVTPIEQLATGPNFLGWEHPPAPAAAPAPGPSVDAKPAANNTK